MRYLSKRFPYTIPCIIGGILLLNACTKSAPLVQVITPPVAPAAPEKRWIITTLAGSGTAGSLDGVGIAAQFHNPHNLVLDEQGTLYVTDAANYMIRKITPDGQVTTYAGNTISNPSPAFGFFQGAAIDNQNNLFTLESSLIRKITSATSSSILAGSLTMDFKDGADTSARFYEPGNMVIDKEGNLYVPDYNRDDKFRIRKISPTGMVTTLSLHDTTGYNSDGLPNSYYMYAIAIDSLNNLYVSANGSTILKKIDPQGEVSLFAGAGNIGFQDGKGRAASFGSIYALTVDGSGTIWVADGGNNAIRKITADGTVTTIAGALGGGFADGEGQNAQFLRPWGIAVDKKGIVYVADGGNNRIRKLEYK